MDCFVKALEALAQLAVPSGSRLPDAAILLLPPALRASSAAPASEASAANSRVPEFSARRTHRKAVPASLLGLPRPLPSDAVLYLAHGRAFEVPIARVYPCASIEPVPDLEAELPVAVLATAQVDATNFRLPRPVLDRHSVILDFTPIAGDVPMGAHLAQTRARRPNPAALLVPPAVQATRAR